MDNILSNVSTLDSEPALDTEFFTQGLRQALCATGESLRYCSYLPSVFDFFPESFQTDALRSGSRLHGDMPALRPR